MCTIGQMRRTPQRQMPVVMIEDADPAAFGGDIDTVSARVVGQHVGVSPTSWWSITFLFTRSTVTMVASASQPTNITWSVTSRA